MLNPPGRPSSSSPLKPGPTHLPGSPKASVARPPCWPAPCPESCRLEAQDHTPSTVTPGLSCFCLVSCHFLSCCITDGRRFCPIGGEGSCPHPPDLSSPCGLPWATRPVASKLLPSPLGCRCAEKGPPSSRHRPPPAIRPRVVPPPDGPPGPAGPQNREHRKRLRFKPRRGRVVSQAVTQSRQVSKWRYRPSQRCFSDALGHRAHARDAPYPLPVILSRHPSGFGLGVPAFREPFWTLQIPHITASTILFVSPHLLAGRGTYSLDCCVSPLETVPILPAQPRVLGKFKQRR